MVIIVSMKAKGFFDEQSSLKKSKIGLNLVWMFSLGHIFLITLSNVLVQYPFDMMGFHTTWGAFTYPAIFILTDLTTRIATANEARKIIMLSMTPGLILSYLVASYIEAGNNLNESGLSILHLMPLRIALACFIAYVVGQLLDVAVFQRYRNRPAWWLAPTLSAVAGNFIDTALFFTIAFYHCSNPFLSQNWPEIAMVDVFFKIMISLIAFVPVYGLVLSILGIKITNKLMV
ncbi:TPA: 7-cyano-7-deazaguanine/7-aminomethyl-7-deazaguanine transporter [Legionella pneumophila subsp. pneumophila]|nr:7-cyano-7-deazaguanine/7-aminomethyl-7-deazaguanine transporter [Legionella pneumophila]HAT8877925.1 7-cyano-7-deazaguanine/7-aminomethyl-7-deazaguanine transporter [Legionella pneumophila subsp. pneumophila]TIE25262.1 7-cyano-7-deazaguanine/7-aminomethyl-7-deazaguanine transporter [Legionella pneumophila]TIE46153.1 7-cyano-7-deazaguanine/7-aminomethyl-7-deazaguanine transporter [Legionella pneumophila]HAT8927797.1 7-cyano-7-deazaguanine/7-aminomethyl-7-deazaguanine transporter [Legionella p